METPRPFINRELSWLSFNRRVLEEARNPLIPLLERVKFLAITANNLDEFFMVRVGSLEFLIAEGRGAPDLSGRNPQEQLVDVRVKTHEFMAEQEECYSSELAPKLREEGIVLLRNGTFSVAQRAHIETFFDSEIFPVLSPMRVAENQDLPLLRSLSLHVLVKLSATADHPEPRYAVLPLEPGPSRLIEISENESTATVLLEDVVRLLIHRFFPDDDVEACVPFRITRNADMSVEHEASDLLKEMMDVLLERRTSGCVRLEVSDDISPEMLSFLTNALSVSDNAVYKTKGPIDLKFLFRLAGIGGHDSLKNEDWPQFPCADLQEGESMFSAISRKDIVLHHPYEAYDPVVSFVQEAAQDPAVLAIKQTLYRVSKHSRIMEALIRAAEQGKNVTALVELKARFDEAANIEWARKLELAGVQVLYGVRGLKTHAKLCLIVRREPEGIRRYLHLGTGNYNESTASIYGDISLFTCDRDMGSDASHLFNAITGYSHPRSYLKLEAAPIGLRQKLLDLIAVETESARNGAEAWIMAKMNSLSDRELVEALYTASQAGVRIALNIRGICVLRPGVPGMSENIRVISIVDRYLEHSRIFFFNHAGDQRLYISSADWMGRNVDRRVELFIPVEDEEARSRLAFILQTYFKDNVNAWELQADGTYVRLLPNGNKAFSAQRRLHSEARDRHNNAVSSRKLTFEPLRAKPRT